MRWLVSAAVGLAAAFTCAANAQAESPWYLEGSAGAYFRQPKSGAAEFFHTATPDIKVSGVNKLRFDTGPIVDIGVGYRLTRQFHVEAEAGYFTYTTQTLNPLSTAPGYPALSGQTFTRTSGARWSRFTGSVNALYDFASIGRRFTPYVGGGIGASADHRTKGAFVSAAGQTFTAGAGDTSTEGFGLLEAGVSISLSPHWAVVPAYRYVHFFAGGEDVAHVAKVGLRYSF